ncbi:MAG: thioredoxin [Rikenellaceae bacterium]|nr:thioredoxin [Rikenellaceae bacterium]
MKTVKLFYLRNCPFCKKALRYIDELKSTHPELRAVEIEMIEESEEPDVAERYDYHYVPTFYLNETKVHEGGIYADEVEQILRKALK